jgi:hypothetical protein
LDVSSVSSRILLASMIPLFALSLARADEKAAENARARLQAARKVYKGLGERKLVDARDSDFEKVYLWSRRWMDAEKELAVKKADKISAVQGHLDRMKKLEGVVKALLEGGLATSYDPPVAEFYRLEAEQWLAREKAE